MEALLEHYRPLIGVLCKVESTASMKLFLDAVVLFLNNVQQNQTDGLQALITTCAEISAWNFCANPQIISHQFFLLLSNTFRMLLTKATFIPLTKQDEQWFNEISILISNLCSQRNRVSANFYIDNNERFDPNNQEISRPISYEQIFFTELFIRKFVRLLEDDLAVNNYEPYHIKYKICDRLLRLFIRLNDVDYSIILNAVVVCLESKIYTKLYQNINLRCPTLSPKQCFFLYQCPKFLRLRNSKQQEETSSSLLRSMVKYSTDIFEHTLPVALIGMTKKEDDKKEPKDTKDMSPKEKYKREEKERGKEEYNGAKVQAVAWYIELLNHFALSPSTRKVFLERTYSDRTLVDQMIEILQTESLIASIERNTELFHADVALMSYAITLLYNLTFEKKIFETLKDKKTIAICEKLYDAKDRTIQFASRTLGAILDKEDIDQMDSPSKVARSFLYFIENTIDDLTLTYHGIRLDGVLTNLESIVQNDQIKEEITNVDEGIALISRCAYETSLDVDTIQRPALRIIDSISFCNELAIEQIAENNILITHIKNLSAKHEKNQEEIANRLLWKVEKESEFISKQKTQEKQPPPKVVKKVFHEEEAIYQYVRGDHRFTINKHSNTEPFDLMISYSPNDKEICSKIYNRLIEDDRYRVAFDEDNTHRTNPQAMAEAVERSTTILMCFSTTYRNSYACRLEAEYAEKRNRRIIPVRVDGLYTPTGWVQKIADAEKSIDFSKATEFDRAYPELISRIE